MKKLCLLISVLVVSMMSNVNAMENSEYTSLNQGDIQTQIENEKNLNKNKEELEKIIQNTNDGIMPLEYITDVRSGWLFDYPLYPQETYYWCGPATMKQAIQYITGSSASQSTYASNMNSNSQIGTYVYEMTNEINRRQSAHTYAYEYMYNWDTIGIRNRIVANAEANLPSIMHALTKYLYLYNGADFGHYLTAIGFMRNADLSQLYIVYVDTYSYNGGRGTTLGQHTDSIENIANSLGGRYLIW